MKLIHYFKLAFAMTIMAACHNDDSSCVYGDLVEAKFVGETNTLNSRVVGNQWTYDKIGIRVTAAPVSDMAQRYKNVAYETESNGLIAEFLPVNTAQTIFFQDKTEEVTFAAYLPYVASNVDALPGDAGVISVNTLENNNNSSQQISINYLYAEGAKASKMNPIVKFTKIATDQDYSFKHKMSRLILSFKASIADGFTGNEIFVDANKSYVLGGLAHQGTFNVTNGTTDVTGSVIDDWDITNCFHMDDHTSKKRTFTLFLLPQDHGVTKKLAVSITTADGVVYKNNITIPATLEEGKSYTYTIILKKNGLEVGGSTITDWEEVGGADGGAMSE